MNTRSKVCQAFRAEPYSADGHHRRAHQMPDDNDDERFYRDTESIAFPKLDDRQLAALESIGERKTFRHGDVLYKAGQRDLGLTIVVRGEVEVFEQRDETEQILATAGPRDFIGDVAMLQGT